MPNQEFMLERHPRLYFPDGDIVLSAKVSAATVTSGSAPKSQLFRVHRPVLRHNSTVFANLFEDAAPEAVHDDVPVVEMIGDTVEALASVLTFIYNPSELHIRLWDPDTPITLGPAVRIANKYLVDGVHAYIVSKVKEDWPLTLEDWDRHEAEVEAMRSVELTSGDHASSSKPLAQSVPEPASAIRFAFEFGCLEILPAAFYQLSIADANHDWDKPDSYDAHRHLPARWSLLDASDVLRVLRGRQNIADHLTGFGANSYTYTVILAPPCLPWWEDASIAEEAGPRLEREGRPKLDPAEFPAFEEVSPGVQDPLKALKNCILEYERISDVSPWPASPRLCSECEEGLRTCIPWARRYVWKKLPEVF